MEIYFNGINGETGEYALPPATPRQLAAFARRDALDAESRADLRLWLDHLELRGRGLREGDPGDLAQAGWGVIFAEADEKADAVREALAPLLKHRGSQAGRVCEHYYQELRGKRGYRKGDSKRSFLARHGMGPGAADPDFMPYYLLIVGDPEAIPYSFQYQLDVEYAVGRIHFDTLESYEAYARSVVAAETAPPKRSRRAILFGPRHSDDPNTALSADQLVAPLAEWLSGRAPAWRVSAVLGDGATKARLTRLLGGDETPDLLFTAGHGMLFPDGDPRQMPHQGALLCQDWPGPKSWHGRLPADFYFAAEDLGDSAQVAGLVSFHFACYSAGTPAFDDFRRPDVVRLATHSFLARLPQRLLQLGELAVIGHVDRAWPCSIEWPGAGRQIQAFEDLFKRLMEGQPVGSAMEPFGKRYAELSTDLTTELEAIRRGDETQEVVLAGMWTACHDARNYAILGDPAVRVVRPEDLA